MRKTTMWLTALLLVATSSITCGDTVTQIPSEVPKKSMVTMLDLGAHKCIPCKMMAPILQKMEEAYKGKAAIIFIDVWEHRDQAERFQIRAIPTQIFFDKDGKEVYRHLGFMSEKAIVRQLRIMGVDQDKSGESEKTDAHHGSD